MTWLCCYHYLAARPAGSTLARSRSAPLSVAGVLQAVPRTPRVRLVLWMLRFPALLAAELLARAAAQDASCSRDLASLSTRLNDVCCAGDFADCSGGAASAPQSCSAACAALWNPFYSRCTQFIDASLPTLASFAARCQSASPTAGPGVAEPAFDPDWSDGCGGVCT